MGAWACEAVFGKKVCSCQAAFGLEKRKAPRSRQWPVVSDFVARFSRCANKKTRTCENRTRFAPHAIRAKRVRFSHVRMFFGSRNVQKSVTQIIYLGKLPTALSTQVMGEARAARNRPRRRALSLSTRKHHDGHRGRSVSQLVRLAPHGASPAAAQPPDPETGRAPAELDQAARWQASRLTRAARARLRAGPVARLCCTLILRAVFIPLRALLCAGQ